MTCLNVRSVTKLAFWTLIVAAPVVTRATTVFSNFDTGFAYNVNEGNVIGNAFDGNDYAEADTFTAGANYTFTTLDIALSCFATCDTNFTVGLFSDSGADAPGSVIESFTVSGGALGTLGVDNAPLVLTSVLNPTLLAGTQYWIVVESGLGDSIAWNLNTTGDMSAQAVSGDNGTTWLSPSGQTAGAYEIDGTPQTGGVPEPGTLTLMLGGGLLLGLVRRARR